MDTPELVIPQLLNELIANGRWPVSSTNADIEVHRVKSIAPDESIIFVFAPPFPTLASVLTLTPDGFWERFYRYDQIDPAKCLVIGEFDFMADAFIILDYREAGTEPSVWRLSVPQDRDQREWVMCASTFNEFAERLGLI